jgi:hypothetical protein
MLSPKHLSDLQTNISLSKNTLVKIKTPANNNSVLHQVGLDIGHLAWPVFWSP